MTTRQACLFTDNLFFHAFSEDSLTAKLFQSEGFPKPNNPNPQGFHSLEPFMIIPDFNTLSVYESEH
jgi:hypothetical protein